MPINWRRGFERVAVATRWLYFFLAALVLGFTFYDRMRVWKAGDILYSGYYFWDWNLLGAAATEVAGWSLWWIGAYLLLKYFFRGLRWVGAGFVAPK